MSGGLASEGSQMTTATEYVYWFECPVEASQPNPTAKACPQANASPHSPHLLYQEGVVPAGDGPKRHVPCSGRAGRGAA